MKTVVPTKSRPHSMILNGDATNPQDVGKLLQNPDGSWTRNTLKILGADLGPQNWVTFSGSSGSEFQLLATFVDVSVSPHQILATFNSRRMMRSFGSSILTVTITNPLDSHMWTVQETPGPITTVD